jgi:hypothetical protein
MAPSWCPWLHPPLVISSQAFDVFFGASRISIAIIPLYSIYIGLARSPMATTARTTRQPKSKRPFFLNSRLESPHSWPAPLPLGVCWATLVSLRFSTITALCPPHTHTLTHTLCYFLRRHPPGGRPSLCVSASLMVLGIQIHNFHHLSSYHQETRDHF